MNFMNNLIIDSTNATPEIRFETNGKISIKGKSLPENPKKFYEPIFKWIDEFEAEQVNVDIKLEYVNTSSSKNILELIKKMDKNHKIKNLDLNWYYEIDDVDMLEFGEMIARIIKRAKTNYIECEDIED